MLFLELHYKQSGDPFLVNVASITRIYKHNETGETRIALSEDKNAPTITGDAPTECSRQSVYRVRESYEALKGVLTIHANVVDNIKQEGN